MRRLARLRAGIGIAAGLMRVPMWLTAAAGTPRARTQERGFFRRVLAGFGIRPRFRGADPAGPGTLYVANHVSWADIPLLGSLLDADFVSKDDVGGWPLLGRLARRSGTLFIDRDRKRDTGGQADAMADRLAEGHSLVLFAEGTTGDGVTLLPFRSSLFASARAARTIQPVLIRYRAADGAPLEPAAMRAFAWSDHPLGRNVAHVARTGAVAEVVLLEAFAPGGDRKAIAARCRDAIAAAWNAD